VTPWFGAVQFSVKVVTKCHKRAVQVTELPFRCHPAVSETINPLQVDINIEIFTRICLSINIRFYTNKAPNVCSNDLEFVTSVTCKY